MESDGILIYGELTSEYNVKTVVKQILTKACSLKEKLENCSIKVCLIGNRRHYDELINELGVYGADEVIITNDDRLENYDKNYYPEIFYQIAQKYRPQIILLGSTAQGKEIAAYCASKFNTGLTADCTNLDIAENNRLLSTRPTFGGQLTADILCKTLPQMATVQENIFKDKRIEHNAFARFEWINIDEIERKIEITDIIKKISEKKDITTSDIVISGGLGACKDNGFELINKFAQKINAAVSGSREAFEKGYITKAQQVGQTGKTISPKLYIAVGISGANQHIAGIKNSGKIIAINKDENAPIFKYADYGLKGDLFKILDELIRQYNTEKEEKQ